MKLINSIAGYLRSGKEDMAYSKDGCPAVGGSVASAAFYRRALGLDFGANKMLTGGFASRRLRCGGNLLGRIR